MSIAFKNLYEFFNYIDYCPLCNSRIVATSMFPAFDCEFNGKLLNISDGEKQHFSIDAINNNIVGSQLPTSEHLFPRRQCAKHHFFYSGILTISNSRDYIKSIELCRYHFIRIKPNIHFTINGYYKDNFTSIRMTTPDYKTKEFSIPLIEFDFSSKKKIDNKLKHIQLLV